jgi:hypothetical protein
MKKDRKTRTRSVVSTKTDIKKDRVQHLRSFMLLEYVEIDAFLQYGTVSVLIHVKTPTPSKRIE